MFDRPLDCLAIAAADQVEARPVYPVTADELPARAESLGVAAWVAQNGFKAQAGEVLLLAGPEGVAAALAGLGETAGDAGPFAYSSLATALPAGAWKIAGADDALSEDAVLGFCLGAYRFSRFRDAGEPRPSLAVTSDAGLGAAQARAVWLARDLINMPANWLGPHELAEAAAQVCGRFGAEAEIIEGKPCWRPIPRSMRSDAGPRARHGCCRQAGRDRGRMPLRRWSPWSARACASTPAATTSSPPRQCCA